MSLRLHWSPFSLHPQLRAEICIISIFILWGLNTIVTKICLKYTSPLVFNALCFSTGGVFVFLSQYNNMKSIDWKAIIVISISLVISTVLQNIAMHHATTNNITLYMSLDIVFTVLAETSLRRVNCIEFTSAIVTFIGSFLLSWDGLSISPSYGDYIAMLAAFSSAAYYVISARLCVEDTKTSICVGQLCLAAITCFLASPVLEVPQLIWSWELYCGLIFSGCICSGIALYALTWALMYVSYISFFISISDFFMTGTPLVLER
jgi:drug/metabolite transporter (DMT)-like permease